MLLLPVVHDVLLLDDLQGERDVLALHLYLWTGKQTGHELERLTARQEKSIINVQQLAADLLQRNRSTTF